METWGFLKNNIFIRSLLTRTILFGIIHLSFLNIGFGQCADPPVVTLSSSAGSTCVTTPATLSGNTFGGSATKVTIKENGAGAVKPASATASPFEFTYTPKKGDVGKVVVITVTTDNPQGSPCLASVATYSITVGDYPKAPVIGTIVQPSCTEPTGSILLSGLPSAGLWTIRSEPGGVVTTGTGTSTILSGLLPGTYTFTVTNSSGCVSPSSQNAIIDAQPLSPAIPEQTTACVLGNAEVTITSPTGTGLEYSLDGGIFQSTLTFSGIPDGDHYITVRNSSGCETNGPVFTTSCACVNSSVITLGSNNGNTCNITPVTVSNNTFSGTATGVVLTHNGAGTVSPATTDSSPFDFTYTPSPEDAGKTVNISVKAVSSSPEECEEIATFMLNVYPDPSAPLTGTITQPTCSVHYGSVVLDGLPSSGTWILTRSPDGTLLTGTGTSTTVTGLQPGSYTFTVTSESGCISLPSGDIVINQVPAIPDSPSVGAITAPTCLVATGSVVLNGLPSTGAWTLTRYPDSTNSTGSGVTVTLSGIASGAYNFTVTNSEGCISDLSPDVIIPEQPGKLAAPGIDTIIQPDCLVPTGSVTLTGLPSSGTWTLTRSPDGVLSDGTGPGVTISELPPGTYSYTVTDAEGCISFSSESIVINEQPVTPEAPSVGTITAPTCTVATGSVIMSNLPSSGEWILTRYPDMINSSGTGASTTLTGIISGTYNFTVTNSDGCVSGLSDDVIVPSQPGDIRPPEIGTITQPDCNTSTGSVELNSLPDSGSWVLTRYPDGIISTGTGADTTITGLLSGSYNYTVTNSEGCISGPSASIIIYEQPEIPAAPVIGEIISPTCVLPTGSVVLANLPSTGTWTLTRYPGTITTTGSGTSASVAGLPSGTYNFTVTNDFNCISAPSENVVIPVQPSTPTEPLIGEITQLVYPSTTGSIIVYGLPTTGTWVLTRSPDGEILTGRGTSKTIAGIPPGEYTFNVMNSLGCSSAESETAIIFDVIKPVVKITDPDPVCFPETVDLSAPGITAESTPNLTFTYWTDADAVNSYDTPYSAEEGQYFIKGTNQSGFFDIKPVTVAVVYPPIANAGPDQVLEYEFATTLSAELNENETGNWSVLSGACEFYDMTDAKTKVTNLSEGDNILLWTVSNGVCFPSSDSVNIKVNDLVIPTLITPNMDGINDYFILRGLDNLGKTQLTIFDRRGKMVYKNDNYDNLWNGTDINNMLLPDDTYFYLVKAENGKSLSGYIIIRK